MKQLSLLDLLRVWAAITGILLAIGYFAAMRLGFATSQMMPLLISAIGGFELFLFGQDIWFKRKGSRG